MNAVSTKQKTFSTLNEKTPVTKYQDLIAFSCFVSAVLFFVWKAPYGFGIDDESAYIAFAHRLTLGDALLTDEWHPVQLTGFLLYLPLKAYMFFSGSTEGVVLFFRYLFVVFQSTAAIVIYCRLRKYGRFSIVAALIFYLHIPLSTLMCMSTYSMGLVFGVMAGVIIATKPKHIKSAFFLAGIFIACAVLCNPVLAFAYFFYTLCMILHETTKKKERRLFAYFEVPFSITAWSWITLGIIVVAIIFFTFIFSRTNLKEILDNLPMILTEPEHPASAPMLNFFKTLFDVIKINSYLFAGFSILTVAVAFDKKRIVRRSFYLVTGGILLFCYVPFTTFFTPFPNYEYWVFPLAWLGLIAYLLSVNKNKDIFVFLWLFGILYMICGSIASDTGFVLGTQFLLLSDVASVIFIKNIVDEMRNEKRNNQNTYSKFDRLNLLTLKISPILLTAALFLPLAQGIYFSSNLSLYSEYLVLDMNSKTNISIRKNISEKLDVTIQTGPKKGVKTTTTRAIIYTDILKDLDYIKEKGNGKVFIAGTIPWSYLYLDMPYAAPSVWSVIYYFLEIESQRLLDYHKLHPENTPKYIYIPKLEDLFYSPMSEEMANKILFEVTQSFDYTVKESTYGYTVEIISM